jgi:hypothetical protein
VVTLKRAEKEKKTKEIHGHYGGQVHGAHGAGQSSARPTQGERETPQERKTQSYLGQAAREF